jgi:hypothetical protein
VTTAIEYALMSGAAYISNRLEINRFPAPDGWTKVINPDSYFKNPDSGFEAVSFTNGTEIVISFAGTDFSQVLNNGSFLGYDFWYGDLPPIAVPIVWQEVRLQG